MKRHKDISLMKHNLLGAYFFNSKDTDELNDPNLILDENPLYPKDIWEQIDEELRIEGELRRYKTKNGIYKGVYIDWLIEITTKGRQSYITEKYLNEYKRNQKSIVQKMKDWKDSYWWAIAIATYLLGLFTPVIQKSIEQKILPKSIQEQQAPAKSKDTSGQYKYE